jgi:hypothetical protein
MSMFGYVKDKGLSSCTVARVGPASRNTEPTCFAAAIESRWMGTVDMNSINKQSFVLHQTPNSGLAEPRGQIRFVRSGKSLSIEAARVDMQSCA